MRVWTVWLMRLKDGSIIVFVIVVPLVLARGEIRQWMFFVGRRLVWGLVVCVVVSFRIQRVVLSVIMGRVERVMLLIFFVVAVGIIDIFDRVLANVKSAQFSYIPIAHSQ
jgi:hypothetical protein